MSFNIFVIAGEESGDILGAELLKSLNPLKPIQWTGIGGYRMQNEGLNPIYDVHDLAVVGLVEVIKHYPSIRKIFNTCVQWIRKNKPDMVLLIDYPGFNLRLAEKIKSQNIPIVYYVSPQVWAWASHRIYKISHLVDRMIVLFEFEKKMYQKTKLEVFWSGHPMVDHVKTDKTISDLIEEWELKDSFRICLLPGSRQKEIEYNFNVMLQAAYQIWKQKKEVFFLVPYVHEKYKSYLMSQIKKFPDMSSRIKLIHKRSYDVYAVSQFGLIASGSATLEAACMQLPFVIVYKVSWLTAMIGRWLIQVPYLGLVNIVNESKIIPEFLQENAKGSMISKKVLNYLQNCEKLEQMKEDLLQVKLKLGPPGSSQRSAEYLSHFLEEIRSL